MAWWRLGWYLGMPCVQGPPAYLNLEPTNRCNLSCRWCVATTSRPPGLLDLGLADAILAQAEEAGVGEVRFFLAGEPLLHPRLAQLVGMASARGLRTVVHTNAMLLTEERARALIEAGLDEISFSINGLDPAVVSQRQEGADLTTMAEHVRGFLRARGGRRRPRAVLQLIQLPHELSAPLSQEALRQLFGKPGPDRVLRLAPHGWGGQLRGQDVVLRGRTYHACQPLWQGMSVGWDGRVFVCCADLNGLHPVGDLARESLMDVWRGPALTEARRLVASNQRDGLPLCRSCDAVWWRYHPLVHDLVRAAWRLTGIQARRGREGP